jgi:hypothetical protein
MSTKRIFSCIIAAFIINVFSSFNIQPSQKRVIEAPLTITYIYQTVVVSGTTFQVYLAYDSVQETVVDAKVYWGECNQCTVSELLVTAIVVNTGGTNWYVGGPIYIVGSCGTIVVSGDFIEQAPGC